MWRAPGSLRRIGKAWRAEDADLPHEPLPDRLAELILDLEEKERRQASTELGQA
jgi:hypothetical protein